MPALRPFPMPALGVGTDICVISRITKIFNRFDDLILKERQEQRGKRKPIRNVRTDGLARLEHFTRRIFTPFERQRFRYRFAKDISALRSYYIGPNDGSSSADPPFAEVQFLSRFLAGRWAAKEAVIKACHWRSLCMDEVQIVQANDSKRVYGVILDQVSAVARVPIREMTDIVESAVQDEEGSEVVTRYDQLQNGTVDGEEEVRMPGPGIVVRVSISHDGPHATAVCIAMADEGASGDVGGEAAAREPI